MAVRRVGPLTNSPDLQLRANMARTFSFGFYGIVVPASLVITWSIRNKRPGVLAS